MTVALSTELVGAAQLGGVTGAGGRAGMGGAGSGAYPSVGLPAGASLVPDSALDSGISSGIGSGSGAGRSFSAAFKLAGGNAAFGETETLGAGKSKSQGGLNATAASEAPGARKESFKANWQPMQRAWGESPHASGDTPEEAAGESGEADGANESSAIPSSVTMQAAPESVGREAAQSTIATSGGDGSTASAAPAGKAAIANQLQPAMRLTSVAAGAQGAVASSPTKAACGSSGSPASSKIEKLNRKVQVAAVQDQAIQGPAGGGTSPLDGSGLAAQAAAPLQMNTRPEISIDSVAQGLPDEVDDKAGVPVAVEQPGPAATVVAGGAKGALLTGTATAARNSRSSASTAAQIPVRATQTPATHSALNSGTSSGVGWQQRDPDSEPEETSTLPQSTLTPATIVNASAPSALSATSAGTSTGTGERKAASKGLATHRGVADSGGAVAAPATAPIEADKPGAETGAGNPQLSLPQSVHQNVAGVAGDATSQQKVLHVTVAQNPGMETSAMVRDPAGSHGTANTPATLGGSAAGPVPAPNETFAALDARDTVGAPSWVHAGGRQAEAGFEDPALGWVSVRADLSVSGVHAAVVPGSADAAQALSGHLAGLSAYLSEQHTPVATLTMAAPGNSGIEAGPDQSMGQGMQQSYGQHGDQNQATALEMASRSDADTASLAANTAAPARGFDATESARNGRGTHISVMA